MQRAPQRSTCTAAPRIDDNRHIALAVRPNDNASPVKADIGTCDGHSESFPMTTSYYRTSAGTRLASSCLTNARSAPRSVSQSKEAAMEA